jgi:molecular chaperone GrpE
MNEKTCSETSQDEKTESQDPLAAATDEAMANNLADGQPDATLTHLTQELEQSRKRELIAQAELENYRKRTQRDVEQTLKFACVNLVRDLVEVVDNLARATDAAKGNAAAQPVVDGVKMVRQQLLSVLEKHHCKPIEAVGQTFDPNFHQAIAQAPSLEYPAGVVSVEASTGYRMHDRVVRPSQVIVSTGPTT